MSGNGASSLIDRSAALAGFGIASSASFIVLKTCGAVTWSACCRTVRCAHPNRMRCIRKKSHHWSPKAPVFVDFAAQIYPRPRWGSVNCHDNVARRLNAIAAL
ncbi:hypothetical protein ACFS07_01885 [Undibacterium arcticum]